MDKFFEWDPARLNLNIQDMDADHQAIVNCMNRLHELHGIGAGRAQLNMALDELIRVTVEHFADEEDYMKRIGFPDALKHGLIHKTLLERMEAFRMQFKATGVLTEEFFQFLKMWLKSHICGIDVKYAAHAKAAA
jgi:hemerythrin-like metal-binding protein